MIKSYTVRKIGLLLKIREVEIVKEVMACDVLPVAMSVALLISG